MNGTGMVGIASMLAVCMAMALPNMGHTGELAREAQQLPELHAPPGGTSSWIAPAMRMNGVPMTIKRITAPLDADRALHHYERLLGASSSMRMHRSRQGRWHVLAALDTDFFATVRVRDTATGVQGTITVTPPPDRARPSTHTRFPYPPSARVVSVQQYDDAGIEAEHIHFTSARSPAIEARAFAGRLLRQGWQVQRSEPAMRDHRAHVIEAQRATAAAKIDLRRADAGGVTIILVVWRKG